MKFVNKPYYKTEECAFSPLLLGTY